MASKRSASDSRPGLHGSRSFTRMPAASATTPSPRKRASTLQEAGIPEIPEARHIDHSPELAGKKVDIFEAHDEGDEDDARAAAGPNPELQLPSTFDDLPVEIKSLSERFLDSLSAKVHPSPLTADALSDMFQDFYGRAAERIGTHIASLASRIGRDMGSAGSSKQSGRARAGSNAKRNGSPASGGEMLTADEAARRKKARRLLELKRVALEEAVERGVTEKVYDRIFKHRSTDDEARDEKLRSRTAALAVVGIGLKELHMDTDPKNEDVRKTAAEKEDEIHQALADAREALQRMDDEHYPAGKLQHLTAAHKSIVETLSTIFPSSSSADEILPTLIYTLITSPPEGISVVSNLNFIQRFRAQSRVDGEAAYCLVNLEAAISFLETVDLSSLRADEAPEGPARPNSRPPTPTSNGDKVVPSIFTQPRLTKAVKPSVSPLSATSTELSTPDLTKPLPSPHTPTGQTSIRPQLHQRRLSTLMQAQTERFEAGRDNLLNAADKVYDSINSTLDNSLQFVFGRFKDQGSSPFPKTLEDARKLVSSPVKEIGEEDVLSSISRSSSPDPTAASASTTTKPDNKMLELLGGRKAAPAPARDRSVDSTRSAGSGKRAAFSEIAAKDRNPSEDSAAMQSITNTGPLTPGANLFNAINPLNRFQVPAFARFGRAGSASAPTAQPSPPPPSDRGVQGKLGDILESPASDNPTSSPPSAAAVESAEPLSPLEKSRARESSAGVSEGDDWEAMNAREALAELRRIAPPRKRFLEVGSAADLRLGEVEELLAEYRRLARAIGIAIAT